MIQQVFDNLRTRKLPPVARGFIALMSMIVVSAVGIAIAVSVSLLGIQTARSRLTMQQSIQARGLANACAEEALEKIREGTSFVGTGGLTIGSGVCVYTVTSATVPKTITTTGTVGTIIRKTQINVTAVSPKITAIWSEIP